MKTNLELLAEHKLRICLAAVLFLGVFFRLPCSLFSGTGPLHPLVGLHPIPKWNELGLAGVDEKLYRDYVEQLSIKGLMHYPEIIGAYIAKQASAPAAILPPTRFLYIFSGYIWRVISHQEALASLTNVSAFFSMLTLGLASLLAWRMRGPMWAVGVGALLAFAPSQLHMSQHALIDGFFSFWALLTLWLLWENLRAPRHWAWLGAYAASLALLVLTKENSFFVWLAIMALLLANHWLQFGRVSVELVAATITGPLLAILILFCLAGTPGALLQTYQLFVAKNYTLPYMIRTGDGPWQRYLVDLFLVSPVVLLLVFGGFFQLNRHKSAEWFMLIFFAVTYAIMCKLKYGMNLRFGNMWDAPLRFIALSTLIRLVAPLGRRRNFALVAGIAFICVLEIRQYQILFVEHPLHELASDGLLRAVDILK